MAVSKKSKKEIIGLCGAVCLQRNADMFLGKLAPAPHSFVNAATIL